MNVVGGRETARPQDVRARMEALLAAYESLAAITLDDIIDFHHDFERIHPFQDGIGSADVTSFQPTLFRVGFYLYLILHSIPSHRATPCGDGSISVSNSSTNAGYSSAETSLRNIVSRYAEARELPT